MPKPNIAPRIVLLDGSSSLKEFLYFLSTLLLGPWNREGKSFKGFKKTREQKKKGNSPPYIT
jgi:hypothetical protein